MFRSVAKDWWRTVHAPYEMLTDDIAWTAFRTDFLKKFIPAYVKAKKFMEL